MFQDAKFHCSREEEASSVPSSYIEEMGLISILLTRLHNCLFRSEHSFLREKSPLAVIAASCQGPRRTGRGEGRREKQSGQTSKSGQKGIQPRSCVHPDSQREGPTSVSQAAL